MSTGDLKVRHSTNMQRFKILGKVSSFWTKKTAVSIYNGKAIPEQALRVPGG
jgi:hypothetical protein